MRIALFPPSLEVGGIQRVILNLAQGFLDEGLAVDLVLIKSGGAYDAQIPAGARIIDLGASRALTSVPKLARYLRRERPDVLLAASEPVNLAAIWARMLARVPTRIAVSVHHPPAFFLSQPSVLREKIYPFMIRHFYRRAEYLIGVSDAICDELSRLTGQHVNRIYNPAFSPDIEDSMQAPLDHPWFIDKSTPVILGVGRLAAQKDFVTLIRAFAKVRHVRPAKLMILGEGPERTILEQEIARLALQDDVQLPGNQSNPYTYMARADLFALTSIHEAFGLVLVEALACGCRVVSTDCPGGPVEILENGRYGRLVPVGDVDAVADAILASLDTPTDASLLKARALDFTIDAIIPEYLALLDAR